MTQLTDVQIAQYAYAAGFRGNGLVMSICICLAESNGNTNAVNTYNNTPPSRDRGLWQINSYWHPEVSDAQAFDPSSNAAAAFRISNHGTSWVQWSTYGSGSYRQFLNRAQLAAGRVGPVVTFTLHRYLEVGCVGADVRMVQAKVGVTQDGIFGPQTQAAVETYQGQHGLTQDGIVGPATAHSFGWAFA